MEANCEIPEMLVEAELTRSGVTYGLIGGRQPSVVKVIYTR